MNYKRTTAAFTAALMIAVTATGCTVAAASNAPVEKQTAEFNYVCDWNKTEGPQGAVRIMAEQQAREEAEQAERDAQQAAEAAEAEWEAENLYYEPYVASQQPVQGNPDGLNTQDGIYEFDGHTETYYSTPAVYDGGLTVDEQGFYRTSDGYYVVASSEHAEGEHVQISQGEAVVMDSGPEAGVIDVHTNW